VSLQEGDSAEKEAVHFIRFKRRKFRRTRIEGPAQFAKKKEEITRKREEKFKD